ncbi:MAG: alpha-hydroxy-acid oxidizing protein [Verrucomicrobia bacterium]|nr:MAG: alpha-hydroxy-acid oxidizing protein [Verrucomicrobiota bacterium]
MFRFAQHDKARSVQSPRVLNIEDLRRAAKRRLPRVVFDYIDGGAEDEWTLRANRRAFEAVTLRPRCAVATPVCDLRTTVLGISLSMPLILAPVGSCRLMYPRGEEAAARAAGAAGITYTLSTLSGCRLEDVAAASEGPVWYQLYLVGGRDCALAAIERARKAGFSALVVTIDTAVAGMRERDIRNGARELLSGKLAAMLPFVNQLLAKPRWLAAFLADGGLMKFENVIIPGKGPMFYADVTAALEQSVVTWDDLTWIRQAWNSPVVIKGIHTREDARRAVDMGVNALVVSNHGGRQVDSVAPTLQILPEVMAAVGDRVEVLMDGGIRRGSDIAKALCLGARAVLVGRAYAYGLGAAGGAGVARAIEILRCDLVRTLKLLGCASVPELDRSYVDVPGDWLGK